jgi:hypothetical protein
MMKWHANLLVLLVVCLLFAVTACRKSNADNLVIRDTIVTLSSVDQARTSEDGPSVADTLRFNLLQLHLVHHQPDNKWPVKTAYPMQGAILPYKRVVAYYGNFYSKGMGILGELPAEEMLVRLQREVNSWETADPLIPVQPALHYIAVTAQASAGKDGKYRLRMPAGQIDKALILAGKINAILFLDVQIGHGSLEEELPALEHYLAMPNVHLGIDPEYSMKGGERPCAVIGTFDAADINFASKYLSETVRRYHLPPKIMVVHRFTKEMVTNYRNIITRPEVQIVMHMDGFGFPAKKIDSYKGAIANEPVQFTGFKIFYKNDKLSSPYRLMTPVEILKLYPSPIYIQYQ